MSIDDREPKPKIISIFPDSEPAMLTYEKFSSRISGVLFGAEYSVPASGNFYLYFAPTDLYRQQPFYQRFSSEHPDMAESLCRKIQERCKNPDLKKVSEIIGPYERDLFEAYKIMHSYGISNKDLFG